MAARGTNGGGPIRSSAAPWNPLAIGGTDMPPNLLLMTKLIVVCFLVSGQWGLLPEPFLPFLGPLDDLGPPELLQAVLKTLFIVAAALLLTNRSPRAASVALALVILLGMLASSNYVENNRLFVALMFLLAGLSDRRLGARIVQLQIVLVYFGAALNKLLDVDWRTGQYFDHLASQTQLADVYSAISGALPPLVLSGLLAWGVIVTEFTLAGAFLLRRLIPFAIWLGIAYHTSLVLITGRTFGMFWYAATASYLAFVELRPGQLHAACGWRPAVRARLRRAVEVIDIERAVAWRPAGGSRLEVSTGPLIYQGAAALMRLAVALPALLFAVYGLAALPFLNHRAVAALVLALLSAFAWSAVPTAIRALSDVRAGLGMGRGGFEPPTDGL